MDDGLPAGWTADGGRILTPKRIAALDLAEPTPAPPESEQAEGTDAAAPDPAEGGQAEEAEGIAARSLSPSRQKAFSQYLWAVQQNAELNGATEEQVYVWLTQHLDDGEQLPSFATWARYVREGRAETNARKNTPRRGRQTGRSIVRPDEI